MELTKENVKLLTKLLDEGVCPHCNNEGILEIEVSATQYVTIDMAMDAENPEWEGHVYSDAVYDYVSCEWCEFRNNILKNLRGHNDSSTIIY